MRIEYNEYNRSLRIFNENNNIKIHIPFIEHQTNYNYNFGSDLIKEQSVIFVKVKGQEYILTHEQFETEYFEILMKGKIGANLAADFTDELLTSTRYKELIDILGKKTRRNKFTNCWMFDTFDYHLKYTDGMSSAINYTPVHKIKIENDDGTSFLVDNMKSRQNKNHPYYTLFEYNKTHDIEFTRYFFETLYQITVPESRWETFNCILDYILTGLDKHYIKVNYRNRINFPMLLITGTRLNGKTYMAVMLSLIFYQNNDQLLVEQNNINSANPMAKVKTNLNSLFPKVFDEVLALESFSSETINNYLTEGYIYDVIGGKKQLTRTFFHQPIWSTNKFNVGEKNIATNDRFINIKLNTPPLINAEITQLVDEFERKIQGRTQIVGATILYLLSKYDKERKEYNRKRLQEDEKILLSMPTVRSIAKTRDMLWGMYTREFLNQTEELKGVFKDVNDIHYYMKINTTEVSEDVYDKSKVVAKEIYNIFTMPVSVEGDKIYFNKMLENDEYELFYLEDRENKLLKGSSYQTLMRYMYYFINELGLYPTNKRGEFIITKKFLQRIADKLEDKMPISKVDMLDMFKKYINQDKKITYAEGFIVNKIDKQYELDLKLKGFTDVIKFDIEQFIHDMDGVETK